MSSFLCFICHSAVNSDTNEETREKYREIVGMNLCPDSHLCHICCHVLNKLSMFRSICLKRSLEYPVLFSEKGAINLQRSEVELHILCPDETCNQYQQHLTTSYQYSYMSPNNIDNAYNTCNDHHHYVALEDDHDFQQTNSRTNNFNDYFSQYNIKTETELDVKGFPPVNVSDYIKVEGLNFNDKSIPMNYDNVTKLNVNDGLLDNVNYGFNDANNEQVVNKNREIYNAKNNDECNDINNDNYIEKAETTNSFEIANDDDIKESSVDTDISTKKIKKKGKDFIKIILTLEEQKAELEANRRMEKYIEAEFKCHHCALHFLFKDTYQAHMMRHEESNGEHQCPTCTLRFASLSVLRAHLALHAERRWCTRCGLALRSRNIEHDCGGAAAPAKAACHLCGHLLKDANGLQQHLKRVHTPKASNRLYSCSVCAESYPSQTALRTHMIKHIKKKFPCDQCPSTFSSPYTLTQHKKVHLGDHERHSCETCGVAYTTRKSLLAHIRNSLQHQQRPFECSMCTKISPNQRALALHMQAVHSTSKDHACPHCPARYTNRHSLLRHVASHTKIQQPNLAVCHLCGTSFKSTSKLNRHLQNVCGKPKLEEKLE